MKTARFVGLMGFALACPAFALGQEDHANHPPSVGDAVRRDEAENAREQPTVLRLARSADGLTFVDSGVVMLQNASSPDLLRLPNGELIAVFDYLPDPVQDRPAVMCLSRSSDQGRSWLRPTPIRLTDKDHRPVRGRHGDLLTLSDGHYRLYFTTEANSARASVRQEPRELPTSRTRPFAARWKNHAIRSAVSRDGVHYQLDEHVITTLGGATDAYPTAFVFGQTVHLLVTSVRREARPRPPTDANPPPRGAADSVNIRHFVSRDARRFESVPGSVRIVQASDLPVTFGTVMRWERKLRAYVSDERGIGSLVSKDAITWNVEPGVRLAGGQDPAVVELRGGGFLMLYVAPLTEQSRRSKQLALAGQRRLSPQEAQAQRDLEDGSLGGTDGGAQRSSLLFPVAGSNPNASAVQVVDGVPLPNFKNPPDYIDWYRQYLGDPVDNAYWSYAAFFPDGLEQNSPPEWPEPNNLYSSSEHGPPAPWKPQDHPEWEVSYQEWEPLRERMADAAQHQNYAMPVRFYSEDGRGDSDSGRPLLMNIILPSLSKHRTMAKANLAAAWRVGENGRVSSESMLLAWRTTLQSANHLDQSTTAIEHLVAIAQQNLVQHNARWALARGVFDEDELRTALDTLVEYDRGVDDPTRWIRGEYAMQLDSIQYMYSPPDADGTPRVNPQRAAELMSYSVSEEDIAENVKALQDTDVSESIDAFRGHFRELSEAMRIGYPQSRIEDVEAVQQKYLDRTPLTRFLLPGLSRIHTLRARNEAGRRATQLSYAIHLYKAQNGQWPASLDELPAEHGNRMRTDPFTGNNFGYRVNQDGPTIYSLSDNASDDGGNHSRRWENGIQPGDSDDYVFWPPQP